MHRPRVSLGHWWRKTRALPLLFLAAAAALAQEKPLDVKATVYTGFYTTSTRGDANQSLTFFPIGSRFDITGYLLGPDLLWFSVQPEVSAGPQASEAGIQGGNGVRMRMTLLRKRAFPLTFRYSNVQVSDVYFGGLTQISGYQLQNRSKDLGLTWEFRPSEHYWLIADWGSGSVNSKADVAQITDYQSQQRHLNFDAHADWKGWDFQGFGHFQKQDSNLLMAIDGSPKPGVLDDRVNQEQGSVRKGIWKDGEFYADGGTQSTKSLLFTLPIDLSTRYANTSLRLFQRRRWRASMRAGYSSNVGSQLLAQAVSGLTGPGTVSPNSTVFLPFTHGMSSLNLSGTTNADLGYGFGMFANLERNSILSASNSDQLNSNYFTGTAGLSYTKKLSFGNFNGQYGRELGYGSVTGQTGTIQGQTYRATFQHGSTKSVSFETTVHGNQQRVHNTQPMTIDSFATDASVQFHVVSDYGVRLGGGYQRSAFINSANEFRTNGYTARLGIDHPRFQFNATLNDSLSNSLPYYNQLLGLGVGTVFINALQVIPSDYRAMGFTARANPLRRLEVSANWTRSRQHLDGVLSNDFQLLNVYAKYQFRRLQLESGYIRFSQMFNLYPNLARERFYIRVQRTVKVL